MHFIKIPEDINVEVGLTEEGEPITKVLTFKDWIIDAVFSDTKLGKTAKDIIMLVELKGTLGPLSPGDTWSLDTTHYEKLAEVVNEPTGHYFPKLAIQVVDFLRAVLSASDKRPAKPRKATKGKK